MDVVVGGVGGVEPSNIELFIQEGWCVVDTSPPGWEEIILWQPEHLDAGSWSQDLDHQVF